MVAGTGTGVSPVTTRFALRGTSASCPSPAPPALDDEAPIAFAPEAQPQRLGQYARDCRWVPGWPSSRPFSLTFLAILYAPHQGAESLATISWRASTRAQSSQRSVSGLT